MESLGKGDLAELARLVEVTSDAVALCAQDGTILHVNRQMTSLALDDREHIVGTDIKDLLFSTSFERASRHQMPFTLDARDCGLMLKLPDGSFVPVNVRALKIGHDLFPVDEHHAERVLVVIKSLEEQTAHDRQTQRLLSELQAANKRLSGTLSVIMSAVGSKDLPTLLDTVLNKLSGALDAGGSTIYIAENGGFKLRGFSRSLANCYVPDFIPYGAGIPTYVLRQSRACRFYVLPATGEDEDLGPASGTFYDMDARSSMRLNVENMPAFKTLIAVPVFFGTQVLGVIELGWMRPCFPRDYDMHVLEVVSEYLSIELMGLVTSARSKRSDELTRSLNRMRDMVYTGSEDLRDMWPRLTAEMTSMLKCRLCPLFFDHMRGRYVLDFDGGSRVNLPGGIDELFFSTVAPAAYVDPLAEVDAKIHRGAWTYTADDLVDVRVVRVEANSRAGRWLALHGLPSQGAFFDIGADFGAEDDAAAPDADEAEGLMIREERPHRMFLLLRSASQEPIDDLEYDYLVHLAHDFEMFAQGARKKESEHRIAQTLQAGMRSSLAVVPGITSDCLYSSATKQALVGGDFYTLIRLPDDRVVMILGDVSGKGVEAASMSALVKTALSAYAWEGMGPQRMARSLNSMLMGFSRLETFATMFIAKIDLRRGYATYCSAGHPPSMLVRTPRAGARGGASPAEIELMSVQSGVVGAFETMSYEAGSFEFSPGDILFMYTDGAIEARDPAGDFFGEQRLRDTLLREASSGIDGLCGRVLSALDAFAASALEDDVAMVALRFDAGCSR